MTVKSVLVVEPEHENRVVVRRALESAGHFVVSATTGANALVLLAQTSVPGLLLVSTNLPFMDAEEFLRLLRANPKYAQIPVAQFLGEGDKVLGGICCTIKIPVDTKELLVAVATA